MSSLRYALVGSGHRAQMYVDAILGAHSDVAELVALSDPNPTRIDYYATRMRDAGAAEPSRWHPDDLERMVAEASVDRVIVTSPDVTHAALIVRALEAGADVVVEKPLTIDADGCRAIVDAVERTGRSVVVTFNYRYSPRNSALKQLISSGEIGRVTSVTFEWVLDTAHGADYFRRWHREKANSGGLLVHKASHHFDLVNWWIDATPTRVFASGGLRFYGAENTAGRDLPARNPRGTHDGAHDPFELDLRDDERLRALYLDAEKHDGYLRDRDVFDAGITIEDNIAVIADYDSGATLSYALNAHAPWEGYRVAVNGTRGRAELEVVERGAVTVGDDGALVLDPSAQKDPRADAAAGAADATPGAAPLRPSGERLIVQNHWGLAREVPIENGDGAHGGGDALLLADVFRGPSADPLGRPSDYTDGLRSVSVGIAANLSLETGLPVQIAELAIGHPALDSAAATAAGSAADAVASTR